MPTFEAGQRVRIKTTAFLGSTEPADVATRGQVGLLIEQVDDDLWFWRGDGMENYPKTDELEVVEE